MFFSNENINDKSEVFGTVKFLLNALEYLERLIFSATMPKAKTQSRHINSRGGAVAVFLKFYFFITKHRFYFYFSSSRSYFSNDPR